MLTINSKFSKKRPRVFFHVIHKANFDTDGLFSNERSPYSCTFF